MLSSRTFLYSGVNGACCAGPAALVGSNFTGDWPPNGGLMASHWPFQFGYFASSHARASAVGNDSAARRTTPIKFLQGIGMFLVDRIRVHHEPLTSCESTPPSRVYGRGRRGPGCLFLAHHVVRAFCVWRLLVEADTKDIWAAPPVPRGRALSRGQATARPSPRTVPALWVTIAPPRTSAASVRPLP